MLDYNLKTFIKFDNLQVIYILSSTQVLYTRGKKPSAILCFPNNGSLKT